MSMIKQQEIKNIGRDCYIDVLKSLSIVIVMLIHFDQSFNCPIGIISRVAAIGARAPQFFFVISAYLTWKSIERKGII